jgi:hypothetical protein
MSRAGKSQKARSRSLRLAQFRRDMAGINQVVASDRLRSCADHNWPLYYVVTSAERNALQRFILRMVY